MSSFRPYAFSALRGKRLHLGVCGSVAAYKAVEIMRCLQREDITVSACLTDSAARFITPLTFASLGADPVYTSMFGQDEGSRFAHLEPGSVADAFLIAPATAATMARLATGFADDMLAAQALAFSGPLVIAPAMNPRMWQHPATQANVQVLRDRGCLFVDPASGPVACGDNGQGKLAPVGDIVLAAIRALLPQDLAGKRVLVTLGPTREQWDGVRVWTNLSTGRMGASLVYAAYLRGAAVHAVCGPGVPALPADVARYDVASARDMMAAAEQLWDTVDFGVFTAAVADFYPEPYGTAKFKKSGAASGFSIQFSPNPDILATLGSRSGGQQKILGFAAETEDIEARTREKLRKKGAHMMAGNLIGAPDAGFAAADNRVFVCDASGREEHWPTMSKADVAWRLLDWLSTF